MFTRTGRWFQVLHDARARQARWQRIQSLAGSAVFADPQVRSRLRALSVAAAARDAVREVRAVPLLLCLILLLWIAVPLYLMAPLDVSAGQRIGATLLGMLVAVLPGRALARPGAGPWRLLVAITAPVLGLVVTAGNGFGPVLRPSAVLEDAAGQPTGIWVMGLRLAAVMILELVVALLLGAACIVPLDYRRQMRRHPEWIALEHLAVLLDALADPRRNMAEAVGRRAIAGRLNALADVLEHGFAAALRLPSVESDAVLRERLRRLAAGIRAHQVAVAMPEVDTPADLRRLLLACLGAICTGRIGSLIGLTDAPPPRRRALVLLAWLRSMLRSTAIALVPLALVVALTQRGILRDDALARSATVAAFLWALTVLLMALDPQLTARIQMVRELTSILRSGGDPKK
ncbi:hypothetical protein [Micromonospora sp. 4G55]|uniref:hypothetical protein n=1 Tax=Micromonospora sp. 4G55 TaxID=2806102 RepID=UPI001A5FF5B1|nr:hypothetical protein [Micromonospora sp. 4G55]MBM0255900.1 hypothetical protein [Micromonospora sp. 4G55]